MPLDRLRVAIGQIRMEWTGQTNTRSMLRTMTQAAREGAQVCVFPELAVTGFHRQIRAEAVPDAVARHLRDIRQACAEQAIAVVAGAPTFCEDGRIFNSCVFIDAQGALVGVVEKVGVTPAEETFFSRGSARSGVDLLGYRTTAVLCREVDDLDEIPSDLSRLSARIVFWPGAMRPAVDGSASTHVQHARELARRTGTFVIQSNWPNSLNYPEESAEAGHSMVVGPDGEILLRLPMGEAGVGVFDLGQSSFEWHAQGESAYERVGAE